MTRCRSLGVVLALVGLCAVATAGEKPVGVVSSVTGKVSVQRAGVGSFLPLKSGARLYPGDVCRTGPNGRVRILFSNGSAATLGPATVVRIGRPGEGKILAPLTLTKGRVWVKPGTGDQIGTAGAIARARG